jgi:hypothetical protein
LDNITWIKDLYNLLWNSGLEDDLMLYFDIEPQSEKKYQGICSLKINNPDGRIKYGLFELPVYSSAASTYDQNEYLGYNLVVILNEPGQDAKPPPPIQPMSLKKPSMIKPTTPNVALPQPAEKNPKLTHPLPKPTQDTSHSPQASISDLKNTFPFIVNDTKQFTDVAFKEDEVIVLYIDSARFLPENTSISRVTFQALTHHVKTVVPPEQAVSFSEESTVVHPFYGLRYEIAKKNHPNLSPTTLLVMRIDTIDRLSLVQKVVGYSFFPLFVDRISGEQCKEDTIFSYGLNNGMYQIPVYCEVPNLQNPIYYAKFNELERIPCASLLIRIERPPIDEKGDPLLAANIPLGKSLFNL